MAGVGQFIFSYGEDVEVDCKLPCKGCGKVGQTTIAMAGTPMDRHASDASLAAHSPLLTSLFNNSLGWHSASCLQRGTNGTGAATRQQRELLFVRTVDA